MIFVPQCGMIAQCDFNECFNCHFVINGKPCSLINVETLTASWLSTQVNAELFPLPLLVDLQTSLDSDYNNLEVQTHSLLGCSHDLHTHISAVKLIKSSRGGGCAIDVIMHGWKKKKQKKRKRALWSWWSYMWALKSQSWKDQHKVNVLINLRNHRVVFVTVEDGAWWSWVPRPSSLMNQLVVKITLGIIGLVPVEDHWVSMGWAGGIKWNVKGRRRGSSSDYRPLPTWLQISTIIHCCGI